MEDGNRLRIELAKHFIESEYAYMLNDHPGYTTEIQLKAALELLEELRNEIERN